MFPIHFDSSGAPISEKSVSTRLAGGSEFLFPREEADRGYAGCRGIVSVGFSPDALRGQSNGDEFYMLEKRRKIHAVVAESSRIL